MQLATVCARLPFTGAAIYLHGIAATASCAVPSLSVYAATASVPVHSVPTVVTALQLSGL